LFITVRMDSLIIAYRVIKDKCWYGLWHFDLHKSVKRIYPRESYYKDLYDVLTSNPSHIIDNIYLGNAFNAADYNWLKENNINTIVNVTPSISNYFPGDFKYHNYRVIDLNEASAAVRGVRSVHSAIPLICSFSYDRGTRTMMGVKPEDMAAKIGSMDVDVLGINCGRSLQDNLSALEQLRKVTDKPIWFKPNAGLPEMGPDGMPGYSVTPQEMGAMVPSWLAAGAQIVGGCCGTSPQHLAEIAKAAHE